MTYFKKLLMLAAVTLGAVSSQAAVTFDNATTSFAGVFELTPFYSAVGIVIGAIAVVASIKLAIGMFKRV